MSERGQLDFTSKTGTRLPKHLRELAPVVAQRLAGYSQAEALRQRQQLVEEWRKAHPEAAAETSGAFHPLIRMDGWERRYPDEPAEYWHNDVYTVAVRRWKKDPVFGSDGGTIQLGISSLDGTARHDWRDFMEIKNQVAGAECEAFELYPAESRRLDPSNYYTLWCFPGVKRIRVGEETARVLRSDESLAPQRALPEEA